MWELASHEGLDRCLCDEPVQGEVGNGPPWALRRERAIQHL